MTAAQVQPCVRCESGGWHGCMERGSAVWTWWDGVGAKLVTEKLGVL